MSEQIDGKKTHDGTRTFNVLVGMLWCIWWLPSIYLIIIDFNFLKLLQI